MSSFAKHKASPLKVIFVATVLFVVLCILVIVLLISTEITSMRPDHDPEAGFGDASRADQRSRAYHGETTAAGLQHWGSLLAQGPGRVLPLPRRHEDGAATGGSGTRNASWKLSSAAKKQLRRSPEQTAGDGLLGCACSMLSASGRGDTAREPKRRLAGLLGTKPVMDLEAQLG
ncbi:hypothetical protein N3K66_001912 [Trichothecium roseum]|uniref:Uncharacterized protein n=1 Tax=Trichothecium roseum TaxID=47278 RepID=A0ACC0V829_9HYPO|nr:hypothetical protein N3K66_001912 [Trichothecium roseum]